MGMSTFALQGTVGEKSSTQSFCIDTTGDRLAGRLINTGGSRSSITPRSMLDTYLTGRSINHRHLISSALLSDYTDLKL